MQCRLTHTAVWVGKHPDEATQFGLHLFKFMIITEEPIEQKKANEYQT